MKSSRPSFQLRFYNIRLRFNLLFKFLTIDYSRRVANVAKAIFRFLKNHFTQSIIQEINNEEDTKNL